MFNPAVTHNSFGASGLLSLAFPMDSPRLCVGAGIVTVQQLLSLIQVKPPAVHLVLTGRGAPQEIVDAADLVTEMRLIKHPYEQGIGAQKGVEF